MTSCFDFWGFPALLATLCGMVLVWLWVFVVLINSINILSLNLKIAMRSIKCFKNIIDIEVHFEFIATILNLLFPSFSLNNGWKFIIDRDRAAAFIGSFKMTLYF